MKTVAAVIEFGTSKIVTLIAESGNASRCDIVGSGTVPYAGYMDGEWNDPEDLLPAIEAAVRAAEVEAKRRIREIYVGVPCEFIHVTTAIGEADVLSSNGVVGQEDVDRVMDDAAEQLQLDLKGGNILHRNAAWYQVDDKKKSMSATGRRGKKLKGAISFIQADPVFIEDIRNCMARLGIEVVAFLAPALGVPMLIMQYDERDRVPVLIDVGYLNTEISVVEGDALTFHAVLPIGGGDITAALAEALEIDMESAEAIKRDYIFTPDEFDAQNDPQVRQEDGSVISFPHDFVREVVESVTEELVDEIQETLKYADDKIQPRSQINVTGGGLVNMRGSKEYLAEKLGRPVKIPMVRAARLNNPRYSASLGLMDMVFGVIESQDDAAYDNQGGVLKGIRGAFKKQATND